MEIKPTNKAVSDKEDKNAKGKSTWAQIFRFVVVGVLNTLVDLAILNLLIWISGAGRTGIIFTVFKSISFLVAVINSYYFNRLWVFKGYQDKKVGAEFTKFIVISVIGAFVNIGVASLFVNAEEAVVGFIHVIPVISPLYDWFVATLINFTSPDFAVWATVSALFGTLAGLAWNFLGYKFLVFKGKKDNQSK